MRLPWVQSPSWVCMPPGNGGGRQGEGCYLESSPGCLCSQAAHHLAAGTNSPGSCFCVTQNSWPWHLNTCE